MSTFHFVRRFEATYGETPIRYLTRRRIERAQDLLRGANLTVTEGPRRRGGQRDISGNWLVLAEPKEFTPKDFA